MILGLFSSTAYILRILSSFKEYAVKYNLSLEVQNVYNTPLISDIKETSGDKKVNNFLLVKFDSFSHLAPRELRSGHFYPNVAEYTLSFTLFFMSTEEKEKTSFKNSLLMYELFNEFLYDSEFSFTEDRKENYKVNVDIFINKLNSTVLLPKKLKSITSSVGITTLSTSSVFQSDFKVVEKLKEKKEV